MPYTFAEVASGGRWLPYKHLKIISDAIVGVLPKGGRLVVSIAPRHGKSELISKWLPTWYLDTYPNRRVILASYEADFAAHWGRQVRNWYENNQHQTNVRLRSDSNAADRWETTQGGSMITAGIGGAFTGRGGDLLIIDDPVKNWSEALSPTHRRKVVDWFLSTFYTRAEPGATIIVLMTRWHEQDLVGYLLKEHSDPWQELKMPAINEAGEALCPERFPIETLRSIQKSLGSVMWESLYQQNPVPIEGGIFKRHWFKFYLKPPLDFDEWLQSWDLPFDRSKTSSFASGQVWARKGADKYLIDEVHERVNFTEAAEAIRRLSAKWPQARTKIIENKANGPAIISALKSEIAGLIAWEPDGSKESRAISVSGEVEAGNIWLPHPTIAPWVNDFIEECATFPKSDYKDRVDSMVQALLRFGKTSRTANINIESITRLSPIGGI